MKVVNLISGKWHAWQMANFLLSDESTKTIRSFPTIDDCINWLFVNGEKETARKLNKAKQS